MRRCYRKRPKAMISCVLAAVVVMLLAGSFFAEVAKADTDTDVDEVSSASVERRIQLTEEEQKYLKAHPKLVVAADASWRPIEYTCDEDGQYEGIIAEVLKKLEAYTGFQIEYKVMDSYTEALQAVQSGEADMISGLANSPEMAEEYHVNLSDPFLMINSAIVSKGTLSELYGNSAGKRVAVVEGDFANTEIQEELKGADLLLCGSNAECLDLVKSKEADMAIIASYCSEYYMSVPKYSSLKSHTISDFSWELAFGVNKDLDPVMVDILNKGIAEMADLDLNEAVYEGVINAAYDNDWIIIIYRHPVAVITGILCVVLVIGALILRSSLTQRKAHRRQVEDGTRLRLALERTHLCIWELDMTDFHISKIDNEHEKHGFYDLREHIPESAIEKSYVHPEDVCLVREIIEKVKNGEQDVKGCWRIKELAAQGKDTIYWWEQVLFHVVYDEKKRPIKVIGVSEDVTKEKNAQKDSLTLVYNRSSFEQMASRVLNERRNAYLQCAFLILDLDGFKQINDTYGHDMGDRVLIAVGATLNRTFRVSDIVGRLGGDEFTVFMTSISRAEDATIKARELVENICNLQEEEGFPFPVSCSLGVVVAQKGQEELAVLYKKADTALYAAKHAGKNQFKIYE